MAAPIGDELPAVEANENDAVSVDGTDTVTIESKLIKEEDESSEGSASDWGISESKIKDEPTISKSQLKKLKKKEKWKEVKAQKRKAEKERYKARKRACRERGEELGPSRKQLRHNTMSKSSCKIRVAVDCDFDDYMAEKDIKMLVKQIQFSYSANRRVENPMQFYCCGVKGKTQERLESLGDYKGWDINFRSQSYLEMFDKSTVVYLSSESPNMLERLEEDKVYIIGGLVDHNHHKGLCHNLAEMKGITHAQLPISEYIDMKTRKVLTINHVFEILLQFTINQDWQKAFYTVLPPRKGAVPKILENTDSTIETSKQDEETSKLDGEDINNDCEETKSTHQSVDTKTVNLCDEVESSKPNVVSVGKVPVSPTEKLTECTVTNSDNNGKMTYIVNKTSVSDKSDMSSIDKS